MRVLVDTNVFVAAVTDEPDRGPQAVEFLNASHEFTTSLLNLMELRTVMTKKKRVEQPEVERVIADIQSRVDVYAPDEGDFEHAFENSATACFTPQTASSCLSHGASMRTSRRSTRNC
ncbi:MAG: type II toxin-antitoxin system VapC family toxin [Haloferacaceae archaeon]